MKKAIHDNYAWQTHVIKAMAHPTRLFILNALKKKETCVCELTDMVGDAVSTVSKHLLVLKNAGLVSSRRDANRLYYRLDCPCVLKFTACVAGIKK